MSVVIALLVPFAVWSDSRRKRKLELKDKAIYISPNQQKGMRWKRLQACHFEPIGPNGEVKFTLKWVLDRRIRLWSIVLADAKQEEQLLAELKIHQSSGHGSFAIKKFSAPVRYPEFKASPAAIWLYVTGMLLLMHGFPLLAANFSPANTLSTRAKTKNLNPHITQFISKHNQSLTERRRFLLTFGGALLVPSGLCLGFAWVLSAKNNKLNKAAIEDAEAMIPATVISECESK
jgi:hypothetical protein